ncbi:MULTISPECIES: InlB B-repeat-containing protein [Bifidobacteriaceae]|uniref:Cell wall/surface repeat protein n=1 Tax=Bifidobacterium tsurumiense TaxID=356829 RepID=A0A087EKH1_9BIFI|nr:MULTISPECIES: InlB B-repeat-containing protein [Bifidobacteriaceae]KFJ08272.1 cell wall/surface repeat protein [Bifidobacterium tsurumiense]MSS13192.1 InlB B-repeat-containing protein [Bifidobacterium tsurumiense]
MKKSSIVKVRSILISFLVAIFVISITAQTFPAFAAYDTAMNNGSVTNDSATTTTSQEGISFEHTLYFTATDDTNSTVKSNLSTNNPAVHDSVVNLDKLTPDSNGAYHFNAVVEITASKDVANMNYDLMVPGAAGSSSSGPQVQMSQAPQFSGVNAQQVQAKTQYSHKSVPGKYFSQTDYEQKYSMNDVYFMYVHGPLSAGQKLTITLPYVLTNADSLDLTRTTAPVQFSENVGGYGITPWGLYTNTDLTTASLRFARTDSLPYAHEWTLYAPYKSDYEGVTHNSINYIYTVNNQISHSTSLDYTYTDVPQISNDVVGLDYTDVSYKNSNESTYTPLTQMFAQNKMAYNRNGSYRIKLDKVKKAFDGTGWSTNGMYTEFYTYTTDSSGLVIHGVNDEDKTLPENLFYIELWHYISAASNICLTVGDTFNPDDGLYWVHPYNKDEVRAPLHDSTQSKLIDVTYTDASGETVANIDTSKPGKYTVTYRYWNADEKTGERSSVSTTAQTQVYISASKNASCPPEYSATVSYNNNGGKGSIDSQTVSYTIDHPGQVTLSDGNAFSRDGYSFKGWNTQADGSGTFYAPSSDLSNITSDITLYALWEKNEVNSTVYIPTAEQGAQSQSHNLAHTGAAVAGFAVIAGILLVAGITLVLFLRRRQSDNNGADTPEDSTSDTDIDSTLS